LVLAGLGLGALASFPLAPSVSLAKPLGDSEPPAKVSFSQQVAPLLKTHCLKCHSGDKPRAGAALDRFTDDASTAADPKTWEKVRRTLQAREMPPPERPQPSDAERNLLLRFAEQLAGADGTKRNPGRVTMRRLNRTEYNNTIRDLVGVDFKPANDFPADDVGYGFDNIGDVLSLSPVLMERYLAAAERIVKEALGEEPLVSGARRVTAEQFQPSRPNELVKGFRLVGLKQEVAAPAWTLMRQGDYILRVRAHGPGGAVRMVLRVDGRDVRTVDVRAVAARPQVFETRLTLDAGSHVASIRHMQGTETLGGDRSLHVQLLELEGPTGQQAEAPVRPAARPLTYQRIMICQPGPSLPRDDAARQILGAFARRAYRRPVRPDEVVRLVSLVQQAQKEGESFETGIGLALQAVLVSPHFLFRVELDPPRPGNPVHSLTEHELASRLSYFLWSSMPDEELLSLADSGGLRRDLDTQVTRMLRDPKGKALVENFTSQWLETRNLRDRAPDPKLFPGFNPKLRAAMTREPELFFGAILQEDRSIQDLLDADFTFVNETLARHYGIAGVKGEEFQRVQLAESQRGGILTMASVLTVTSNPTRTSPVKRGKWILENILNAPPPPPPPDAGELKETPEALKAGSLRQRMEQHRARPECASCHARMDPLGFGFENFDAIGSWRSRDGAFAIDPSGTLPGGESFQGPAQLKKILRGQSDAFARCLAEKMLTYALGRGLEVYDRRAVDEIVRALGQDRYRLPALVRAVVHSEPFQLRGSGR
jgi:hypothetical protein